MLELIVTWVLKSGLGNCLQIQYCLVLELEGKFSSFQIMPRASFLRLTSRSASWVAPVEGGEREKWPLTECPTSSRAFVWILSKNNFVFFCPLHLVYQMTHWLREMRQSLHECVELKPQVLWSSHQPCLFIGTHEVLERPRHGPVPWLGSWSGSFLCSLPESWGCLG